MNAKIASRVSSALLVSCALLGMESTASAIVPFSTTDSFETNHPGPWVFGGSGSRASFWANNPRMAYEGSWAAYLWAIGPNAWNSVGRNFTLSGWSSASPGHCNFSFKFVPTTDWAILNLEVIDPDTWTYIALKQVIASNSPGWQTISVNNWVAPHATVHLRLSVVSNNPNVEFHVLADSMALSCS